MVSDAIVLSADRLDPQALAAGLGDEEHGAHVSFAGVVRRHEGPQRLSGIDYQAYANMASSRIEELLTESRERWPGSKAVVAHRTGVVPVGEISVWIGVSAGHRDEAFDAARFLIDELKARVPIWKREHLPEADPPS